MKAFEIKTKKSVLIYLHGLRGHAFAQRAALQNIAKQTGVSVVSLELPGHGADAQAERCMVPRVPKLIEIVVEEIKRQSTDAERIFLMGYSFGAALMVLASPHLQDDQEFDVPIMGVTGISTAFAVGHNVPAWQLKMVGVIAPLSRFLYREHPDWSRLVTIREMNVDLISLDPVVRHSIHEDELVYKGRIPLNTSAQVYKAGVKARKAINSLKMPVLLLHSKDDPIALAPKEDAFKPNVTVKLFDGLRHNCIDGVLKEVVVARRMIIRFVVERFFPHSQDI